MSFYRVIRKREEIEVYVVHLDDGDKDDALVEVLAGCAGEPVFQDSSTSDEVEGPYRTEDAAEGEYAVIIGNGE